MQRTPDLPPLRGGIKGGVSAVSGMRNADHLHQRISPPSVPPRWGGKPACGLHEGCGRWDGVWMEDCGILSARWPDAALARSPSPQGRDKGWGEPGHKICNADHFHQRVSPPSVPPRWGGRSGRALHATRSPLSLCGEGPGVRGVDDYSPPSMASAHFITAALCSDTPPPIHKTPLHSPSTARIPLRPCGG